MIVQDALNVPALTVYYDAACPICNGEMHNLMLRDVARQVRFVDASAPGFERPDGVGQADLMNLLHVKTAAGSWLIGVDAFAALYRTVGLPVVSQLLDAPLLRPLARLMYPVVARYRYLIPRWVAHAMFETGLRHAAQQAQQTQQAAQARQCGAGTCPVPQRSATGNES